jgi:hypothetical protein
MNWEQIISYQRYETKSGSFKTYFSNIRIQSDSYASFPIFGHC